MHFWEDIEKKNNIFWWVMLQMEMDPNRKKISESKLKSQQICLSQQGGNTSLSSSYSVIFIFLLVLKVSLHVFVYQNIIYVHFFW